MFVTFAPPFQVTNQIFFLKRSSSTGNLIPSSMRTCPTMSRSSSRSVSISKSISAFRRRSAAEATTTSKETTKQDLWVYVWGVGRMIIIIVRFLAICVLYYCFFVSYHFACPKLYMSSKRNYSCDTHPLYLRKKECDSFYLPHVPCLKQIFLQGWQVDTVLLPNVVQ